MAGLQLVDQPALVYFLISTTPHSRWYRTNDFLHFGGSLDTSQSISITTGRHSGPTMMFTRAFGCLWTQAVANENNMRTRAILECLSKR